MKPRLNYKKLAAGADEIPRSPFSEKELIDLTTAVIAINGWNRLAVRFRALAGSYQPSVAHGTAREC